MKTIKQFLPCFTILVLFITGGCKGPMNQMEDVVKPSGKTDIVKVNPGKSLSLLPAEEAGVLFMREEEKLARDVYVEFFRLYPNNEIFSNISESEQKHMDAMLRLINFYGLEDSASPTEGVFNDPELQVLYDDMISRGAEDLVTALSIGVEIELKDIEDLEVCLETEVKNLLQVYDHLLKGSENHLKSFLKVLDKIDNKID